jgi:hypothetical protein
LADRLQREAAQILADTMTPAEQEAANRLWQDIQAANRGG